MKKYKTLSARAIEIVECERESDSSVWIDGRRHLKESDYESYFETFLQAKLHLINRAQDRVNAGTRRLKFATDALDAVHKLKDPTP